jgi:hypothetical protein
VTGGELGYDGADYADFWRATITGTRANSTTAALIEPNNIPTNPPRP